MSWRERVYNAGARTTTFIPLTALPFGTAGHLWRLAAMARKDGRVVTCPIVPTFVLNDQSGEGLLLGFSFCDWPHARSHLHQCGERVYEVNAQPLAAARSEGVAWDLQAHCSDKHGSFTCTTWLTSCDFKSGQTNKQTNKQKSDLVEPRRQCLVIRKTLSKLECLSTAKMRGGKKMYGRGRLV